MSGELDQVSQAIGELKGLMEGHGRELGGIKADLGQIKTQSMTQYIELNKDGCGVGRANMGRLTKVEERVEGVAAGKITGRDWGKMAGAGAGITTVIVAIVEGVRQALTK